MRIFRQICVLKENRGILKYIPFAYINLLVNKKVMHLRLKFSETVHDSWTLVAFPGIAECQLGKFRSGISENLRHIAELALRDRAPGSTHDQPVKVWSPPTVLGRGSLKQGKPSNGSPEG